MLERRKKDVISRELEDELLIYNPKKCMAHYLNETAGFIWKKINGKRSVEDIAKEMEKKFEISKNVALRDVKKTLATLSKLQLLNK